MLDYNIYEQQKHSIMTKADLIERISKETGSEKTNISTIVESSWKI